MRLSAWILFLSLAACNALQLPSRRQAIAGASAAAFLTRIPSAFAFDGGVGGLGKTKPETGVVLREGSAPIQNAKGIVTAEILSGRGNPILVEFITPWPLLATTSGLEARDLQQPESSFIQMISGVPSTTTGKALNSVFIENIFGSKGKYGAYGTPTDIKIKKVADKVGQFDVTFTALTPAMRESERRVLLNTKFVDDDTLLVLVTGTTLPRYKSQEATLQKVVNSFFAVEAPKSVSR